MHKKTQKKCAKTGSKHNAFTLIATIVSVRTSMKFTITSVGQGNIVMITRSDHDDNDGAANSRAM